MGIVIYPLNPKIMELYSFLERYKIREFLLEGNFQVIVMEHRYDETWDTAKEYVETEKNKYEEYLRNKLKIERIFLIFINYFYNTYLDDNFSDSYKELISTFLALIDSMVLDLVNKKQIQDFDYAKFIEIIRKLGIKKKDIEKMEIVQLNKAEKLKIKSEYQKRGIEDNNGIQPRHIYKIFICSTIKDKAIIRQLIYEKLRSKSYIRPILSENPLTFPKSIKEVNTFESSILAVDQSDILLLILGKRYGEIHPSSNISITEAEYDEAKGLEIPVIVFIDQNVITQYDTYNALKKRKRETIEDFLNSLKESGYDDPAKLMRFISKIVKLRLTTQRDNWYWTFLDDRYEELLERIEFQIENTIRQLEESYPEEEVFDPDNIQIENKEWVKGGIFYFRIRILNYSYHPISHIIIKLLYYPKEMLKSISPKSFYIPKIEHPGVLDKDFKFEMIEQRFQDKIKIKIVFAAPNGAIQKITGEHFIDMTKISIKEDNGK